MNKLIKTYYSSIKILLIIRHSLVISQKFAAPKFYKNFKQPNGRTPIILSIKAEYLDD